MNSRTSAPPVRRTRRITVWVLALTAAMLAAVLALTVVVYRHPLAVIEFAGRATLRWKGFEKTEVRIDSGRIVYFRAGSGPPLLFIHGATDQAGTWARVAPSFTADHHVVVMDLAGHGESDPRTGPLTIANLVDGVTAVITAEAKGQPVTIVGNSLGGFLALVYATRHPAGVAHAILVNGAVLREQSRPELTLLPKNREEARRAFAAILSSQSPAVPNFVLDDVVRRVPGSALARLAEQPESSLDEYLLESRLTTLEMPVTMIWGEEDRLLSVAYARKAAAALPHARLELMAKCGHIPQRECPGTLIARLREALARAPERTPVAPAARPSSPEGR